jgi:hypothetical protein
MILTGFYGSENTPCTVFAHNGWYCVEGSVNVNRTQDILQDGVNVEIVADYDVFTWSEPINSLEELIEAVEA